MSRRGVQIAALSALALALVAALAGGAVWGSFGSKAAASSGNSFAAAADFIAPTVSATRIAKTGGGSPGYIKKGGTYYVYANVSDSGNPASGVASVTANVSTITSGQTAATLSAGSYTVDGVAYNRRSASLTAGSSLAAGTYSYSLTSKDTAGNSETETGFTVTVDNTAMSAADVQTANGSTIVGRAQQGDSITYTFSEPPDPDSILNEWDGEATSVVLRLNNATGSDTVTIYNSSNSTQLPLGTVKLGQTGYTSSNRTFGASGTPSTMVLSGDEITITLGTQSRAATTAGANGTMTWTPSATVTDRAGNAMSTTARTETGAADKEF